MQTMKKIIIALITMEILDCVTTVIGLRLGFTEANVLLPTFGWIKLNLLKVLFTAFMALALVSGHRVMLKYAPGLGVSIVFATGMVLVVVAAEPVVSNIATLLPGPQMDTRWWTPAMVLGYFSIALATYCTRKLARFNYSQLSAYRKQVLDGKRKVYAP